MRPRIFASGSASLLLALVQFSCAAHAFDGYQISDAARFGNLEIRFIRAASSGGASPMTLGEAVANGGAAVFVDGGAVDVRNVSSSPIFVGAGTLLKGGWQDQVVSQSVILPPRSGRVRIETFCVDPFRATERRGESGDIFSVSGALFPWHVARLGMLSGAPDADAARNLRKLEVWWSIDTLRAGLSRRLGASPKPPTLPSWKLNDDESTRRLLAGRRSQWTASLPLMLESRSLTVAVKKYEAALLPAALHRESNGAVFVVNGKIAGAEVYHSPLLFQKMWPHLLRAFAVEALASGDGRRFKPLAADTVEEFLRSSEAGPARAVFKYPAHNLTRESPLGPLIGALGKTETLTPDRAVELLHALETMPTQLIKSVVRDGRQLIFAEISGLDGQWVHRSFLPKLDPAANASKPEELIISALEAGRVEGQAIDSFDGDTEVIARRSHGAWSLTVEGVPSVAIAHVRPATGEPASAPSIQQQHLAGQQPPMPLPRQKVLAEGELAFVVLASIVVAILLGIVFFERRHSRRRTIKTSVADQSSASSPTPEVVLDAGPGARTVPALVSYHATRLLPHLVACTDPERLEDATSHRTFAEIECLAA